MKTTTFETTKDIVIKRDYAVGCQVGDTGVTADESGRKIIKAGTPVGGATDVLKNRDTVLTVTNCDGIGGQAQGVVDSDVDVTAGTANAALLVRGVVDLKKLDASLTINGKAQAQLASRILFQQGAN